jgi:transcriptional regulator with XRE-family HTH domain
MTDADLLALFADRLTLWLSENGMSRKALADKMGVAHSTVSEWCRGTRVPRMAELRRLCLSTGRGPGWWMGL